MIHGKYFSSRDDITPIMALRIEVFCREQGYDEAVERDKFDDMAFYALVYDENEQPAATGRLIIDDDSRFRIGRICTRKECRRQGYGDLVVRMLMDLALRLNAPSIVLDSQMHAVHFYEKYGFKTVGKAQIVDGQPHMHMEIAADAIQLDNCAHCKEPEAQA